MRWGDGGRRERAGKLRYQANGAFLLLCGKRTPNLNGGGIVDGTR